MGVPWLPTQPLTSIEELMLEQGAAGETLDMIGEAPLPGLGEMRAWGQDRTIRASVLQHVLTGSTSRVAAKGIRLRGVRINGLLDLEAARVRCQFWSDHCYFDDPRPLALDNAIIPALALTCCRLAGLSGSGLAVEIDLALSGSVLDGSLSLPGARIAGTLACHGTRLGATGDGRSLIGQGLKVGLSAYIDGGFTAAGGVVLARADIGGQLRCRDAHLGSNPEGTSLDCGAARIGGSLLIDHDFTAEGAIYLNGSDVTGQIRCDGAQLGADSHGNALRCDGIKARGGLVLDLMPNGRPFRAAGALRLTGAQITGSLSCRGAELGADEERRALVGDEMSASVGVLLYDGFAAAGTVRLAGANIGGQLRCRGAKITGSDQDGDSLVGTGLKVGGTALLDVGFTTAGAVDLLGADIGGSLSLQGAQLGVNRERRALNANGIRVSHNVELNRAPDGSPFIAAGSIQLSGADITGSLRCHGARLYGRDQDGDVLNCIRAKIAGSVFFADGFTAAGAVLFTGADIGGSTLFEGARIGANKDQNALVGDGVKVGRDVLFTRTRSGDAFSAAGAIRLTGADIGGQLSFPGACLNGYNREGDALLCNGVKIGGSVYLDREFTATGAISLRGAIISRELRWEPARPLDGEVSLEGARVQQLTDNWSGGRVGGYWPEGRLRLGGFTYEGFGGDQPVSVDQRLEWIRSQFGNPACRADGGYLAEHIRAAGRAAQPKNANHPTTETAADLYSFTTQPYKQLAEVYRRAGLDREAQTVEIARRRDLRHFGDYPLHRKALDSMLDITIRYGYRTWRVLVGLVALYLIVFSAFVIAQHESSLIVPATAISSEPQPTALHCVTGYPCFYPAGYAVDVVFPLINVHQAQYWRPNGDLQGGWAWVVGTWLATGLGWLLATLLVVGYSGLARRE